MKKTFIYLLIFVLSFQMFSFRNVVADDEKIALDLKTVSVYSNVMRGQKEYGVFDSQNVLIIKPGFTTRESSTSLVIDYVLSQSIDVSLYRYAVIEYYKTAENSTMKFRPSIDGKMKYILFNGTSNRWHRAVWELLPEESETAYLGQFHFFPFDEQDANSISDKICYIKSIEFYKKNPLTNEEIELNKQIEEELKQQNENIHTVDEEVAIFEDLDKLDKTEELLKNADFENTSDTSWKSVNSTFDMINGGAYTNKNCARITNRSSYTSGIKQDIKNVLVQNGNGDYRAFAYIKNDVDSPSTYNDYKMSLFIDNKEVANSTFHIKSEWQKINAAFRINNTSNINSAYIKISGVKSDDTSDFYVDNVSLKKCLYNEEIVSHNAYIGALYGNKFMPDENITRADVAMAVSKIILNGDEVSKNFTSGYPDIETDKEYYPHIAYLESLGYLSYFEDEFKPDLPITRIEFAYLVNNISLLAEKENKSINDLSDDHQLYNDAKKVVSSGIFALDNENNFNPDALVTRRDAVKAINKALKRCCVKASYSGYKISRFDDIYEQDSDFEQIVEATTTHTATIIDKGDRLLEAWDVSSDMRDEIFDLRTENEVNEKAVNLKSQILNSKDEIECMGTKYYISNNGNDNNTGLSPENAWKTLKNVNNFKFSQGDAVLFERGSLFRGATIYCQSGVTYAAYGEGEKPKLYGSDKNYADPSLWQMTSMANVWTTTEKFSNVGFLQFDGEIMSQKVFSKDELNKNYNFMQEKYSGVPVLLYCDKGNPGSVFQNIEIAPEYSVFIANNKSDIRIDNICMKYTGWHGVKFSEVQNVSITNCEVGWIGGTGGSPTSSQTRWGNGIEFWGKCKNIVVDHCYVHQVYDTGITNQWKGESSVIVEQQNIVYKNNLVERCTYAFEFFMNQPNSNGAIMKDISINNNICRYTGYGWGQDNRPNKETTADIKGWSSLNRTQNFVVNNNIFYDTRLCNVHFASYSNNIPGGTKSYKNTLPQHLIKLDSNVYVNSAGKTFADYNFNKYAFGYSANYDFIKDNVDINAKFVLKNATNILLDSQCSNLSIWTKSKGSKATLTVLGDADNKYLSLSNRTASYDGIDQTNIFERLNTYGPGKYTVNFKMKFENATSGKTGEVYLLAPSYKNLYSDYKCYAKVTNVTDSWNEYTVTFDTSKLEFDKWPEDSYISFRENSKTFDAQTSLCIDDVEIIPEIKYTYLDGVDFINNKIEIFNKDNYLEKGKLVVVSCCEGEMVDITINDISITKNGINYIDFDMPLTGDSYKFFIWDSFGNIRPFVYDTEIFS